ncbi:MAG: ribonuclease J [Desulfobacteraceae bacterium 4572_130]|nr:MAG: ribonuclease J [Desulfobacteraceae bacterium 4572_130]
MLKIIPLGGLGEIGLNMTVVEYKETIFIIDAGIMFPENHMLGIDVVIPEMNYIEKNKHKIKGIILTHAHEDHIGALPYLLKKISIPVYATSFTLSIIKNKLKEFDLLNNVILNQVFFTEKIFIMPFEIEFIRVSHSTVDGAGLAITTPEGLIVHTGDFRINNSIEELNSTDILKFAKCGEKRVLALFSDSTNVEKKGYTIPDEKIIKNLGKIVAKSKGRAIITLFSSNVLRIQQIIDIAIKNKRKIVFNGRSIEQTVLAAREIGYIKYSDDMCVNVKKVNSYPDNKIVIITTGSQGEPMSALLRMATGFHKQIDIKKGDTVILSSRFIPGNEKAVANIINKLYERGAYVIYNKIAQVHASGHAYREELKLMIRLTKPRYFIPIHGEYRHLVIHAKLAEEMGVLHDNVLLAGNGDVICFHENKAEISDKVNTGRVLIDGKGIGDVGTTVLKERHNLSEDGLVIVSMIIDRETGIVLYGPDIVSKGFVFGAATGHLVDDAQCVILEIVEDIEIGTQNRVDIIRNKLQKDLKKYFFFTIRRRPVIMPIIIEL